MNALVWFCYVMINQKNASCMYQSWNAWGA